MRTASLKQRALIALEQKANPPTVGSLLRAQSRTYWLVYLVAALAVAVCWTEGMRYLSVGLAGMFIGRVIRDFQWSLAIAKEWPLTLQLIDWKRVEEIANDQNS